MKKKSHLVLQVLTDRIDVVRFEGADRVESTQVPLQTGTEAGEWAEAVRGAAGPLGALVERMKARGARTRVLYQSPTQAVDLATFAVRSAAEAIEAGKLACTDSLPYAQESAICDAAAVGRDATGDARQSYVVAVAEREDMAGAISRMVQDAGLTLSSSTPLAAAVTARLVQQALEYEGPPRSWLYIGQCVSFFVIAGQGRLLFSRRIDLGLQSLVNSLQGPVRTEGKDDTIELDADTALEILLTHGIPPRDQVVEESRGLTGGQVIPLLQPVLQRYIVELRQSLRFGLSEEDRLLAADSGLSIGLTGPGAAIRGLADLVANEVGVEVAPDQGPGASTVHPGSEGAELDLALADLRLLEHLNLLSRDVARRQNVAQFRRWLWAGAAAAMLLIAFDGVRYQVRLGGVRRQAQALAAQRADLEAMQSTSARLGATLEGMEELARTRDQHVGSRADLRALLHELSRITPPSIRFLAMSFQRRDGTVLGTLSGYAFFDDTGRTVLESYIRQLRGSPLFDNVVLKDVQMGTFDDAAGQRFRATFDVVAVPQDEPGQPRVAHAAGEGQG